MDTRVQEMVRAVNSGEYLRVMRLAQQIIESPEGITDAEAIQVAREGAAAAIATDKLHLAGKFSDEERRWADGTGDAILVAIAAYHQGTVSLRCGDVQTALERFAEFKRADDPPRPELDKYRFAAWFNLGEALSLHKEPANAMAAFRATRDVAEALGNTWGVIKALLQMAWTELLNGNPEPAGAYLDLATTRLATFPDDGLQTEALTYRAFHSWRTGDIQGAVDLCREVLQPGRKGQEKVHVADAAWIAGECALLLGKLESARGLAGISLEAAMAIQWSSAINRANDLRRRITEAGGRPA